MPDAFLLSAARTPIGKYLGALAEVPAPQLGAVALQEALRRARRRRARSTKSSWATSCRPGSAKTRPGRRRSRPGLPDYHRRLHGQQGVRLRAQGGDAGRPGDPRRRRRTDPGRRHGEHEPGAVPALRRPRRLEVRRPKGRRRDDPRRPVVRLRGLAHGRGGRAHRRASAASSRAEQDRFAAQSQQRAAEAWERGAFAAEVVPVTVGSGAKAKTGRAATRAFGRRRRSEALAKLQAGLPRRRHGDGRQRLDAVATAPRPCWSARPAPPSSWASSRWPASSPTPPAAWRRRTSSSPRSLAVRQVLDKADWSMSDIDLFELNEAFAAQMLACGKELRLDESEGQRPRRRDRAGPSDRGVGGAGAGDAAVRPGAARPAARPGVAVPGRRQRGGDGGGAGVMNGHPLMPVPKENCPRDVLPPASGNGRTNKDTSSSCRPMRASSPR